MEPKSVNRLSDGLEIIWDNNVSCLYPYKYLRLQCACANCVEELTGKKLLKVYKNAKFILSSSSDTSECIKLKFPKLKLKILKVSYCINFGKVNFNLKKNMITYSSRKLPHHSNLVISYLKPHLPKQESIEDIVEDVIDEFEENEQEQSSTMTHFINATDVLDVQNNEGKELLLQNRAEKNLKPLLEYSGDELPKEAKLLIEKISQYSKELKDKFCR